MIENSKGVQEMLMRADVQQPMGDLFDKRLNRKKVITYNYGKGLIDVRTCFKQTMQEDLELINYYLPIVGKSKHWDEIAIILAKAVNKRLRYVTDINNWGKAEYWARPIDAHRKQRDDCDGYAVLTSYLWGLFGIPYHRRFVRAGWVTDKSGNRIGHATACYCSLKYNEFFPIEGSFYASDSLDNFNKVPLRKNELYGTPWWLTNEEMSYGKSPWIQFAR